MLIVTMASNHTSGWIGRTVLAALLAAGLVGFAVAGVAGTPAVDGGSEGDPATRAAAIGGEFAQTGDRSRLVIDSTGEERVFYDVTVSGSIELGEEANPVEAEFPDSASGNDASGSVLGGTDDYTFTGELTDIDIRGGTAVVLVDGERIDPEDVEARDLAGEEVVVRSALRYRPLGASRAHRIDRFRVFEVGFRPRFDRPADGYLVGGASLPRVFEGESAPVLDLCGSVADRRRSDRRAVVRGVGYRPIDRAGRTGRAGRPDRPERAERAHGE